MAWMVQREAMARVQYSCKGKYKRKQNVLKFSKLP